MRRATNPALAVLAALAGLTAMVGAANAQDWALRDGDEPLPLLEMRHSLLGADIEFYDGGRSRYSAGGAYSYTYAPEYGGGTAFGTFAFREDGIVCASFRNGFSRCDMFVRNEGRLVLLTEDGERFPVMPPG